MANLNINHELCNLCNLCITSCPFNAMEVKGNKVEINEACKMCKICVKKCPNKAISLFEEAQPQINKGEWEGILVYAEQLEGEIHPVTLELIGKAKELAGKITQKVYCVLIGSKIEAQSKILLEYGVDHVFAYDYQELEHFKVDVYANAFEDCINNLKPAIVLVGATSIGRSLAPRLSTRFRTGLTADCTVLDIHPNFDLVQIRPAFGGNIMAQISTPNNRPQFATVRYKVMDRAQKADHPTGSVNICTLDKYLLKSKIHVLEVLQKVKLPSISDAEVLVVAGRGVREQKDLAMLKELASLLGGQLAVTRSLVEAGWESYTKQIGLSGRTVKPKLIITCGVSGAIQFTASMNSSEIIFAINRDKNAPIFKVAHYCIVGDLYEMVPVMIRKIRMERNEYAV